MKRTILIEVLLLFVLSVLVLMMWKCWNSIKVSIYYYKNYSSLGGHGLTEVFPSIIGDIILAVFVTLSGIVIIAVMFLIALKDFPVFKPIHDKFVAKSNARKAVRTQAKADKAEAAKQARIEQLQAELEELKKDDT